MGAPVVTRGSASTVKYQPATHSDTIDWRQEAECRKHYDLLRGGGDPWFPPPGKSTEVNDKALKICHSCPVKSQCLDYALEKKELKSGIFGGKTPTERQYIFKKQQQAKGIKPKTRKKRKAKAA